MRIIKRPLSKKEKKMLAKKLANHPIIKVEAGAQIEEAKVVFDNGKEYVVYFVCGKPAFWVKDDEYLPVLCGQPLEGPAVVVDQGAVKHITNGADVMRPGIVKFEGDFKKGDIVLVKAETLPFPIAVGRALYDREEMEKMERGRVVKNLHHLGDELFQLCKK